MNSLILSLWQNIYPFLIIFVLILINGFFVAAEFSLIGTPKVAMEKLSQEGNRTAKKISHILENSKLQDKYIATSQLGITLASLGLGMYGEYTIAQWIIFLFDVINITKSVATIHGIATVASIVLLSYMHVVIGEMLPKSIALQNTQRLSLIITPLMLLIQTIFYPLVWIFHGLGSILVKAIGIDRHEENSETYHTSEELQFIVKESREGGMIEENSANLIQELLEFGESIAEEVMVPRVRLIGIALGANHLDLIETIYMNTFNRYPIYDKDIDHIIGFIHIKDLLQKIIDQSSITMKDVRDVHYISKNISLNKVFSILRNTNTQIAVIVDDYGGTDGIITMEDIFKEVGG